MDLPRRAALEATLFGLHVCAVSAGATSILIWAVFHWGPAAIVGGVAWALGGVLSLLVCPRALVRPVRPSPRRGLLAFVYSMALLIVGALLARSGARSHEAPSPRAAAEHGRLRAGAPESPLPFVGRTPRSRGVEA